MTYGMEVLLKLNLQQTRDFFAAFFALSDYHWKGFLSSRLSLPELIVFGLTLFVNLENRMKVGLLYNFCF
jgi:lycopene beta-cyclase